MRLANSRSASGGFVWCDDADSRRLQGIPGIGPQGAATIRAELGDVMRSRRVDAVVAYAGPDPHTCQSGAFVGQKHLAKRGPVHCAMSAI
jgi:transposase